jgi:hypothetical protein
MTIPKLQLNPNGLGRCKQVRTVKVKEKVKEKAIDARSFWREIVIPLDKLSIE